MHSFFWLYNRNQCCRLPTDPARSQHIFVVTTGLSGIPPVQHYPTFPQSKRKLRIVTGTGQNIGVKEGLPPQKVIIFGPLILFTAYGEFCYFS